MSFVFSLDVLSQDCDCLISQVENNLVSPCDYTVGTIVTVASASEFRNAVIQANSTGGNMTILIEDGTYEVASTSWYPYITGSNIVFRSASGNRDAVILTGRGMVDVSPNTEIGIYAVGDNITIADLTIKDVGNHAIAVTGNNLYVYNVKIQNTYEQMIKGNSREGGIRNGSIKCSLFEYTEGIGPQWYIGGLDIHGGVNWNVSDNIFLNIASPSQQQAEHAIHFWDFSADNIVERNQIVNCDRGIGFGLGASPNDGGVIKNNMITNDGSHTFNDVGIGLETSPNTKVFNNSIYIEYQNAIEYRFSETKNVEITNNLTNKAIQARNGGTASLVSNQVDAISSWFIDLSSGNLRLSGFIPEVVDQGTTLDLVADDVDKFIRPRNGFDIGASEHYELVSNDENRNDIKQTRLFPVPADSYVTIISSDINTYNISIYNNIGTKVSEISDVMLKDGFRIEVEGWVSGFYYVVLSSTESETETLKMFVR